MIIKIVWNHANHRMFAPFAADVHDFDGLLKLVSAIRDHSADDPLERLEIVLKDHARPILAVQTRLGTDSRLGATRE